MHDNFSFYILTLAALILGATLIYYFFFSPYAVTRRKLFNENGKNIFSFQNGEIAKIVGTIENVDPPLIAPLSGKNCAYYHIVVQEYKKGYKVGFWRTIIEEERANNFIIKDGNSYAVIETEKSKSYLKSHRIYTSGFLEDPTVKLENYLSKHGFKSSGGLGMNYSIRYMEGILEEGEMLAVVGKGSWKRKSEIIVEVRAEKILVIARPDDQIPVFFSNEPKTLN